MDLLNTIFVPLGLAGGIMYSIYEIIIPTVTSIYTWVKNKCSK